MGTPVLMGWLDRIVDLHFGGDELVVFRFGYDVAFLHQSVPPSPLDCSVNIEATSKSGSILGDMLDGKKAVGVTNPVSAAMLANLYSWTPKPSFTQTSVHTVPSSKLYFIDNGTAGVITKDNAFTLYPGGTNQCGERVDYISAAGAAIWPCNGTFQNDVLSALNAGGLPVHINLLEGGPYTKASDAQYVADAFNASHYVIGPPGIPKFFVNSIDSGPQNSSVRVGAGVVIVNAGLLQTLLPAGATETTVSFNISSGASDITSWDLSGLMTTNQLNFHFDAELNLGTFGAGASGKDGGIVVTATITFGKDPTVTFDHA